MKKTLLYTLLFALAATMLASCGPRQGWTHGQRQGMHEMLLTYRQMVYVDDLTANEFTQFADEVTKMLEAQYPQYTALSLLPAVADTVDVAVRKTIAAQLKADAHNIRHIYPYNYLVAQRVLPAGLNNEQQRSFYNCLGQKVYAAYDSEDRFVRSILAEMVEPTSMRRLQAECAADLFDWTITEIDIIDVE